jgi:hypothetical protein
VIPRDDDVVAVDASARAIIVVYTEDVSESCGTGLRAGGASGPVTVSTKVMALRVDRETYEETMLVLSSGMCGRETGPFFTNATGGGVTVAWVERVSGAGKARAPIAGLAHVAVPAEGGLEPFARVDVAAEALVDAGCDEATCYAVALTRGNGEPNVVRARVPGIMRVVRYR